MPLTKVVNNVIERNSIGTAKILNNTISSTDFVNSSITGDKIKTNTLPLSTFAAGTANTSLYTNANGLMTPGVNYDTCINRVIYNYNGYRYTGAYGAVSYLWIPGCFYDYTPLSSSSILKFSCSFSVAWIAAHAIDHFIFYTNTNTQVLGFNESGYYVESMVHFQHYVSSWGRFRSRIGLMGRQYGTSDYSCMHSTMYFDGTTSYQTVKPQIIIEELAY
jgi:hypothetical protein